MQSKRKWMMGAAGLAATLALILLPGGAKPRPQAGSAQPEEVPAYHREPPSGELPETMDPEGFDHPVIKNAYALAAKVKKVLYQQPCYCHCDKGHGHSSLLDCFTSKHGSMCNVCMAEAIYSYEQTQKGKTPAQIRAAIIAGDWQHVDGSKYTTYPAKP
jgi:hypothetical protein